MNFSRSPRAWGIMAAMLMTLPTLLCCSASAQEDRGIAVGEKAPEFTLKNQKGEDVGLEGLLEEHNVALIFYRSASW